MKPSSDTCLHINFGTQPPLCLDFLVCKMGMRIAFCLIVLKIKGNVYQAYNTSVGTSRDHLVGFNLLRAQTPFFFNHTVSLVATIMLST